MNPDQVLSRIDELEQRITTLRKQEAAPEPGEVASPTGAASEAAGLQTELDGLWDLRRRQDAARTAGKELPGEVRKPGTVGDYLQ